MIIVEYYVTSSPRLPRHLFCFAILAALPSLRPNDCWPRFKLQSLNHLVSANMHSTPFQVYPFSQILLEISPINLHECHVMHLLIVSTSSNIIKYCIFDIHHTLPRTITFYMAKKLGNQRRAYLVGRFMAVWGPSMLFGCHLPSMSSFIPRLKLKISNKSK